MSVVAPERSPARPGPGATPEALLRALDLHVARRVDALLAGDHRAVGAGEGTELALVRPYRPGDDDVRRIDWNVTARTTIPHVRVHVAERALESWLLLDVSPSMQFGTGDRRKADVAEGAALVVSHLATRRGNRLGVLAFGAGDTELLPPRHGRAGLLGALLAVRRAEARPVDGAVGATSVGAALEQIARVARRPALVACVSDFRGPRDWGGALRRLAARADVLAVEVRDEREQALPDVGDLRLVDPETGRHVRVDTASRKLRERYAAAAAAERETLVRELRAAGAEHAVLETRGAWLRPLASFLTARRRRR